MSLGRRLLRTIVPIAMYGSYVTVAIAITYSIDTSLYEI